jgi:large subunit ribosomal protein L22
MGRAFRYQRRLTHIVLSVAEREAAQGLVTRVEELPVAPKATKAKTGESKAAKTKAEEPKATTATVEAPKAAPKATKKKAGTKA